MANSIQVERSRNQPSLFSISELESKEEAASSSTFTSNMSLPIHRWFRYSAGFSARWVQSVIENFQSNGPVHVFDPFAGSATTLLAEQMSGVESWGTEGLEAV